MRTKTLGGRRKKRPRSATRPSLTTTQEGFGASEHDTSRDNDDELRDVPMADHVDQHSNGSPLDVSNHESIDSLDKTICICCNKGGGLLVCSERCCPVALHDKCTCSEPKFDDLGNFYCPYCWYKRVVDKCQEMKRKVVIAKQALSSFLDKDVVSSDKLVQKDDATERKEPNDGDGISLGCDDNDRQGFDGIDIPPLQPMGEEPQKLQNSDSIRCEIALEDQADGDGGFIRPCTEEEMPVGINLVQDSIDQEKFDEPNKTETVEIRFLEWKECLETEDSRRNMEDVRIDEIAEEAEPLSALHLGNCTDRHSPDIGLTKGTQESVTKSSEKGRKRGEGKMPHRKQKVSATGSSVSETYGSDSEVISGRKRRGKRKIHKTAYRQNVAIVSKSLLHEHNTKRENPSDINEEVTSSRTRRHPQSLSKKVNNWTSMIRRKKLPWTAGEEKALQDGVLRLSKLDQNIPWRRILESGRCVFDKTRTPVDLKDKWRNMISKEGCK